MARHWILDKRVCAVCDSLNTYVRKNGYEVWHLHDGYYLCNQCFNKYVRVQQHNLVLFKSKFIKLNKNPRKGKCLICYKKIGDMYLNCRGKLTRIKQTAMHHIKYHKSDPLKHTIESCASCHRLVKIYFNQ